MASPRDEYDLVLRAPSLIESELAQQLLEEAGIMSLLHPVDSREAFALSRHPFDAPDLFVPNGMGERAEAVLGEAWADRAPNSSHASSLGKEEAP
jgi:hypothetical protein